MIPSTFDELERTLAAQPDALGDFWRQLALEALLERMSPDEIEAAYLCGRPSGERNQRRFRVHLTVACETLGIAYDPDHRRSPHRQSAAAERFEARQTYRRRHAEEASS